MIIYLKNQTLKDGCTYKHAVINQKETKFNNSYIYLILFKSFYLYIVSKIVSLTDSKSVLSGTVPGNFFKDPEKGLLPASLMFLFFRPFVCDIKPF